MTRPILTEVVLGDLWRITVAFGDEEVVFEGSADGWRVSIGTYGWSEPGNVLSPTGVYTAIVRAIMDRAQGDYTKIGASVEDLVDLHRQMLMEKGW